MSNFYAATSLIGGGSGALDAIDGTSLADGDGAVVITDSVAYFYHLNATSGEDESPPQIIRPDTDAGDKRWILDSVYGRKLSSGCRMYISSNQDIVTGTWTKVAFDSTIFDVNLEFDAVKNRIKVKQPGYYIVVGELSFAEVLVEPDLGWMRVKVNATTPTVGGTIIIEDSCRWAGSHGPTLKGTTPIHFDVADYVEMFIIHDYGANREIQSTNGVTWLAIIKVGD